VELHDIQGLKYSEIAQITSVPLGTVMSRISRGRRCCRPACGHRRQSQTGQWRYEGEIAGEYCGRDVTSQ